MTEFIYCIVDQRDGNFNNVFFAENDAKAKRHFEALLLMPESQMSLFPADFYLTTLGSFDHVTGKFANEDFIKPICTGVELAMVLKQNISCLKESVDITTIFKYLEDLHSQGSLPAYVIRALASGANKQEQSDLLPNNKEPLPSHEQRKASILGVSVPDEAESETCEVVNK